MVWFQCDACGDSLKKPTLARHLGQCRTRSFTCIDCSVTFDRDSVQASFTRSRARGGSGESLARSSTLAHAPQGHTSCVTEHQKYALQATKPGGKGGGGGGGGPAAAAPGPTGLSFLATAPPWVCSCCNVTCTSRETLEGCVSLDIRANARL